MNESPIANLGSTILPAPSAPAGSLATANQARAGPQDEAIAALRTGSILVLILLAGAVLRLAVWAWFHEAPLRIIDEQDYHALARNLLERGEYGHLPGKGASLRPPLYPAFVAGVSGLFGLDNFQAVRLLQAGLSLVTVLVLYRLTREVATRQVALWSAGLYCFYPSLLGYNNLLLTEVLFTLLLLAACYTVVLFLRQERVVLLLAAGVLLGLAALTRSVVWLLPPFLALFLLLASRLTWSRRILAVGLFLTAFAGTLAPWAIRNTRLEKSLVVIDTMGGRNFMMGNYRHTPFYRSWDAISVEGEQSWIHEVAVAYPPSERATQGCVDKLALRRGLKFVSENPGLTLKRDIVKFFDFWGMERELVAGAGRGHFGPLPGPAVVLLAAGIFGSYAATMALALVGLIGAPPADRRYHFLFLLVIGFICGMHTLVFGHSRYHLPLIPLLLIYAACGVVSARRLWQLGPRWRLWLAGGLFAVLVAGWVWSALAVDFTLFQKALALAG